MTITIDRVPSRFASAILWVQGLYFLITGVWPIVHIDSFLAVTGPKTDHLNTELGDHWLVITVGALIAAIAASLLRRFGTG
jgi:hypothetical protein